MRTIVRLCAATALLAATACGTERAGEPAAGASPSASAKGEIRVMDPDERANMPNPGTGEADPRLVEALLPDFEGSVEREGEPAAGVRFPLRDPKSMFIASRVMSSYYGAPGAACTKWTGGLWAVLATEFERDAGVQLAVTNLGAPPPSGDDMRKMAENREQGKMPSFRGLGFSETIVTAPPAVLARLGDARVPPACGRLTASEGSPGAAKAAVEPVAVERLGDGATAFRIVDTDGVASHWVEIVRMPGHLIEIRIPNQSPEPPGSMMDRLRRIARAAHGRAAAKLG